MKLKFWGVRGSINSPLCPDQYRNKLIRILEKAGGTDLSNKGSIEAFIDDLPINLRTTFGGNTSCVTINDDENLIILDAGTGIRNLGNDLISGKFPDSPIKEYNLFFSHLHLDHINGLPFFAPVHFKDVKINFYSHHKNFESLISQQQNFNYFPVSLESRPCTKKFFELNEEDVISIGDMTVFSKKLNHPNGSYSYKIIDKKGKKIVYATDGEYTAKTIVSEYFDFFSGADILIFDSQYNFNELAQRFNFGHSTAEVGVDAAVNSGVKKLVLYHHNHENDDDKISRLFLSALKYRDQKYSSSELDIIIANEGMEIIL
jgi:phosphoribosyl 1,2-cyclic phosphodiesterase